MEIVEEVYDLTHHPDWQIEILDELREQMLCMPPPISMVFVFALAKDKIREGYGIYAESLALEVLPHFCHPADKIGDVPEAFYRLGTLLFHHSFAEIKRLQHEFQELSSLVAEGNENMPMKPIFISHASKDAEIVEHFVDMFLCLGLEISHQDIFCTTIDGMKITTGEEWRHSILDALKGAKVVFALISPNYLASEMCLVELGAAWGLGLIVLPVAIPPLSPGRSTVLLNPNQTMKIDSPQDLDQLRVDACKALGIEEKVHVGRWNKKKDQFVKRAIELCEPEGGKK